MVCVHARVTMCVHRHAGVCATHPHTCLCGTLMYVCTNTCAHACACMQHVHHRVV